MHPGSRAYLASSVAEKDATGAYLWGVSTVCFCCRGLRSDPNLQECGGCPPGKYKTGGSPGGSSSSTGCTRTCHANCRTCEDTPATWTHRTHRRRGKGHAHQYFGNDIRHCSSCKSVAEGWLPYVAMYVGTENFIHMCKNNLIGTQNKMERRPYGTALTANSDGKSSCVKVTTPCES